jgi:hypothetical protein
MDIATMQKLLAEANEMLELAVARANYLKGVSETLASLISDEERRVRDGIQVATAQEEAQ